MSVGVKVHDDLNIYSCYKKINNNKSNWNASSLHGIQCVSWKNGHYNSCNSRNTVIESEKLSAIITII